MTISTKVIVSIDSGGTKTICCAVTTKGQLVGVARGGPSNSLFLPEGEAATTLRQVVLEAVGGSNPSGVVAIYLSAPGVSETIVKDIFAPLYSSAKIKVDNDVPATFRGTIPSGEGIVVLSGTGSFACALKNGTYSSIGGWGPLLGDEGSGYWIGLEALKRIVYAIDKRGPDSSLREKVRKSLDYAQDSHLRRAVYHKDVTRAVIASLAPLVATAAAEGDLVAQDILARAGRELGKLAKDLANQLGVQSENYLVSLTGGIAHNNPLVVRSFRDSVKQSGLSMQYVEPFGEPWLGAVINGLEMAEVTVCRGFLEKLKDLYGGM